MAMRRNLADMENLQVAIVERHKMIIIRKQPKDRKANWYRLVLAPAQKCF